MDQRRPRLGDVIDDYCPRERRVTNHAVVAMIGDDVKQTRCTTCDAEHAFKGAKAPPRRKRVVPPAALSSKGGDGTPVVLSSTNGEAGESTSPEATSHPASPEPTAEVAAPEVVEAAPVPGDDDGPVHRRLIRATLPRVEGQVPTRQIPAFTMRQPGVRHASLVDGNGGRNGPNGFRPFNDRGGSQNWQPHGRAASGGVGQRGHGSHGGRGGFGKGGGAPRHKGSPNRQGGKKRSR